MNCPVRTIETEGRRATHLDLVLGALVEEGLDEREDEADDSTAVDDGRLAQHLRVVVLIHLFWHEMNGVWAYRNPNWCTACRVLMADFPSCSVCCARDRSPIDRGLRKGVEMSGFGPKQVRQELLMQQLSCCCCKPCGSSLATLCRQCATGCSVRAAQWMWRFCIQRNKTEISPQICTWRTVPSIFFTLPVRCLMPTPVRWHFKAESRSHVHLQCASASTGCTQRAAHRCFNEYPAAERVMCRNGDGSSTGNVHIDVHCHRCHCDTRGFKLISRVSPLASRMAKVWSMWRPAMREHAGRMYRAHRSYSCASKHPPCRLVCLKPRRSHRPWSLLTLPARLSGETQAAAAAGGSRPRQTACSVGQGCQGGRETQSRAPWWSSRTACAG